MVKTPRVSNDITKGLCSVVTPEVSHLHLRENNRCLKYFLTAEHDAKFRQEHELTFEIYKARSQNVSANEKV